LQWAESVRVLVIPIVSLIVVRVALAVVTTARAEPLGTHVAPWAPTGEVVAPGQVRLEYTVVAHVGAAVGVAPGLELRVGAGALLPPVQLYEADAALRGQLVRAGALRVTVGAQAMAASLDGARGQRHGGELGLGLYGSRGHVAWSRRRLVGGAAAIDVDLVTASVELGVVRAVAAAGRIPGPPPPCARDDRARGQVSCPAAPALAHAFAAGVQFHGGRVSGSVGLAAALYADYPPVPLPYLIVSIPWSP
jgi:hypothetical protein